MAKEKRVKDKTMRGEEKHRESRERLMEEISPVYAISKCFLRVSSVTGPMLKRKNERIKQKKKKFFFSKMEKKRRSPVVSGPEGVRVNCCSLRLCCLRSFCPSTFWWIKTCSRLVSQSIIKTLPSLNLHRLLSKWNNSSK